MTRRDSARKQVMRDEHASASAGQMLVVPNFETDRDRIEQLRQVEVQDEPSAEESNSQSEF